MNPLRSLFMTISRMPPAVMLLSIVGLAVLVTLQVTSALTAQQKAFEDKQKTLVDKWEAKGKVVYTTKDIPEGQTIPTESLEEREIEVSRVPLDAITSSSLAAGRVSKYGISAGSIVSQHDLMAQGISLGFESRLKEGMRAVTFAVDNNTGVAGFVNPESRVDILGMVGSGADTKAAPILSDIEVIAVGQVFQKNPANTTAVPASSITVSVSPQDTAKLIKAICASKLYLSLRNDNDHTPVATVDITSLYAKPPAAKADEIASSLLPASTLPPPPLELNLSDKAPTMNSPLAIAPEPPKPLHEIELWSGGKKDLLTVPAH